MNILFWKLGILILLGVLHSTKSFSFSSLNPWATSQPSFAEFPTFLNPALRAPYKVCSPSAETYGFMKSVEVIPCEGSEVTQQCPLVKGTNVTLDVEFIPSIPAKSLQGSVSGVLSKMLPAVRFGKPEDLCASLECPLTPGQLYHYRTTVFVKQQYPRLSLHAKVLIQGDNQEIACALIPVQIMDKAKANNLS